MEAGDYTASVYRTGNIRLIQWSAAVDSWSITINRSSHYKSSDNISSSLGWIKSNQDYSIEAGITIFKKDLRKDSVKIYNINRNWTEFIILTVGPATLSGSQQVDKLSTLKRLETWSQ
jgi:hypothetical protein